MSYWQARAILITPHDKLCLRIIDALGISYNRKGFRTNNGIIYEDLSLQLEGRSPSNIETDLPLPDAQLDNMKSRSMISGYMSSPTSGISSLNLKYCLRNPKLPHPKLGRKNMRGSQLKLKHMFVVPDFCLKVSFLFLSNGKTFVHFCT